MNSSNNNSFWHNFSFFNNMSFNLKKITRHQRKLFLSSKKEQQAFFVVFCVFFFIALWSKTGIFFFFLSTEFIELDIGSSGGGCSIGIIIGGLLGGGGISYFFLLKLNMLWMAFSIFFVKYVYLYLVLQKGFFSLEKKIGGFGVWRLTKKPKLGGRGFSK